MTCEKCDFDKSLVIRTVSDSHAIERERQCCNCGWRWKTVEAKSAEYQRMQLALDLANKLRSLAPEG